MGRFEKLKGSETLKILATGKTGSGKSTLLNGLIGSKFVVDHSLKAQTAFVEKYEYKMGNLKVIVWDSPGLQDKTNDNAYTCEHFVLAFSTGGFPYIDVANKDILPCLTSERRLKKTIKLCL